MKTFGNSALKFLKNIEADFKLPQGISCLLPFENPEVIKINKVFYRKYYNDQLKRKLIIGINPGRFGSGITGISFTDPIKLENVLNIKNSFVKRAELSSDFIYKVIHEFGGPELFYKKYYLTAVSPIGFIKDEKNINYYDDKKLNEYLNKFIVKSLETQIQFGIDTSVVYCLGEGQNFKYLKKLNDQHHYFDQIVPLAHPRFIMQYKRKMVGDFVKLYVEALNGTFKSI